MNPLYADVRYESGHKAIVSIHDLLPLPQILRRDNDCEMRDKSELTVNDAELAINMISDNIQSTANVKSDFSDAHHVKENKNSNSFELNNDPHV